MKPAPFLPTLKKPFGWDLVTVLDPRVSGRTLQLWLMVREFPVARPKDMPDYIATPVKRALVSPMIPSDNKSGPAGRETISFAVVDSRYPPQVVELCFTPRQAELFRKSFAPSEKAIPALTAKEGHPRFKCYVPGCKATSSDVDFIGAHFEQGVHPNISFEKQKVQVFRVNGPQDPALLLTPSPFYVLPAALEALEGPSSRSLNATSLSKPSTFATATSVAGSKRPREYENVANVQASKAAKTNEMGGRTKSFTRRDASSSSAAGEINTSSGIDQLVYDYMHKHPVSGEIQAEDRELLCTCLQPADSRQLIECSNGDSCRLQWYHLECLGLTPDDLPGDNIPWFCPSCIKQSKEGKKAARVASLTLVDMNPRKKLRPRSARARAQQAMTKDMKELGGVIDDDSSDETLSPPSALLTVKPWTADMVSSFGEDLDNIDDYDLTSLASAKAALRARAAQPIGLPAATRSSTNIDNANYSSDYKSPNCRSWTAEEEQHLKEVVKECVDAGLAGEALWAAAHPKLMARGVHRPIGGMKMRWCRGLRDQTKIDERRKKNKKLLTAVQKPKTDRDPDAPKKGRFKGKAYHAMFRASASSDARALPADTSLPRSFPAIAPLMAPATATLPITSAEVFGNRKITKSHNRAASI